MSTSTMLNLNNIEIFNLSNLKAKAQKKTKNQKSLIELQLEPMLVSN